MSAHLSPGYARSALAAAFVTLFAVVGLDVVAGERVLHTVPLGMIATTLGVFRVRSAGRHRGFFALVSGGVVVQSALHAASALVPTHHGNLGAADHILRSDAPVTSVHLLLAAVLVACVVGSEHAFLLLAALLHRTVRWLRPLSPPCIARAAFALPSVVLPATPLRVDLFSPRGPPSTSQLLVS